MNEADVPFSEDEVHAILRRAVERQERMQLPKASQSNRLSLAGIEEIAGSVGVSPEHVRAAARDVLLERRREAPPTLLGVPKELRAERRLPGAISDAGWERIVALFREQFRSHGIAAQFGEVREWVSSGAMPIRIRVAPDGSGTAIEFRHDTTAITAGALSAGGTIGVIAALSCIPLISGDAAAASALLPLGLGALGAGAFGGAVLGGKLWLKRQHERIRGVLDRVELIHRTSQEEE